MTFVITSWILGFVLAVAFMTDGVVYLTGTHRTQRRMGRLDLDADIYRAVGAIEMVAGLGLVMSAMSSHPGGWPALFHSSALVWAGLPCALILIVLKIFLVEFHRRRDDDLNEYASAMALVVLCVGFLIAFLVRQIVV